MKDTLKRILGIVPTPAKAETVKEEVNMTTNVADTVAKTDPADMATLLASFEAMTSQLAESQSKVAELTTALSMFAEQKAAAEALAAAAKLAARKEKVVMAVGTVKADALMAAMTEMSDGTFDAVLSAMATTVKAEANSPMFKEVGVEGSADPAKLEAEASNGTMQYLKSQYPTAK